MGTNEIIIRFEGIVRHEYFLVVYGVLIYYLILYAIKKDEKGKTFSWKDFKVKYKLHFVISLALWPLIVVFDDELLLEYNQLFNKNVEFGTWFYLSAGPIGNFLYSLVKTIKKNWKSIANILLTKLLMQDGKLPSTTPQDTISGQTDTG